jgi:hypothetical protein
MPASSQEVPKGQNCENCEYFESSNNHCHKFNAEVKPQYWCAKWEPNDDRKVTMEDIEKWAGSNETIHKYRERYGDNYQIKINEVKTKMMSFKDYANK